MLLVNKMFIMPIQIHQTSKFENTDTGHKKTKTVFILPDLLLGPLAPAFQQDPEHPAKQTISGTYQHGYFQNEQG